MVLVLLGALGLIVWGADAVACRWRWRQRCSSCPIATPIAMMPDAVDAPPVIQMPYVPADPVGKKMPYVDDDKKPNKKMPKAIDPPPSKKLSAPLEALLDETRRSITLPDPAAAMILVLAPDGAQVYLDNHQSRQATTIRSFHTPPLEAGNYVCEARVEWEVNGVRVRQTRMVPIRPGQIAEVVFHEGELIALAQAR